MNQRERDLIENNLAPAIDAVIRAYADAWFLDPNADYTRHLEQSLRMLRQVSLDMLDAVYD